MIKYEVKNNATQQITNTWTSEFAGADYYEPCFGLPERPEIDNDGKPTGNTLPAEYTIIQTDIGNAPYLADLRVKRNQLLSECDWSVLSDNDLTTGQKTQWKTYRQALRDLPQQEGLDPQNPIWPTKPS